MSASLVGRKTAVHLACFRAPRLLVLPSSVHTHSLQEYVIGKVEAVLKAAGSDLSKLVKVNSELMVSTFEPFLAKKDRPLHDAGLGTGLTLPTTLHSSFLLPAPTHSIPI